MERLTQKDGNGNWYVGDNSCYDSWAVPKKFYGDAIDRLAHYENLEKRGRWGKAVESKLDAHTGEYWEEEYYNCLECDYASDWKSPYCPNCGAWMDGKSNVEMGREDNDRT